MPSGDRITYRSYTTGFLATTGNTESARTINEPIYEGLVVDVILDHTHPEYSPDGYNVGTIKIRIFNVSHTLDDEKLHWADPIDSTIQEIPLIGELVVIHKVRGNFFYTKKVPVARRLQENGMLKLNENLNKRLSNSVSNAAQSNQEITIQSHKFGEYFKPDSRVRQLKHFEGDVIIQGRMGNSIRFGSSAIDPGSEGMAPNIIIRAGQAKNVENDAVTRRKKVFGLILEDVNNDASSIWVTSDQTVPFRPSTIDAGSFVRSISSPPQRFDKAQIILNSERLLLNAKDTHIMLFANQGIHLNSFKDTTIDTDSSFLVTANVDIINRVSRTITNIADSNYIINAGKDIFSLSLDKTSFLANKIYLGSQQNEEQPLVCGTLLAEFLREFIDAHLQPDTPESINFHVSGPVPSKLNPKVKAALLQLKGKLKGMSDAVFNSKDNFVMLDNEPVQMELNAFESGKAAEIEKNTWILTEPYYKVA